MVERTSKESYRFTFIPLEIAKIQEKTKADWWVVTWPLMKSNSKLDQRVKELRIWGAEDDVYGPNKSDNVIGTRLTIDYEQWISI